MPFIGAIIGLLTAILGWVAFMAKYLIFRLALKILWATTLIFFFLKAYSIIGNMIDLIYKYLGQMVAYINGSPLYQAWDWVGCFGIGEIFNQFLPLFDFGINTMMTSILVIIVIKMTSAVFRIFASP
jgi:hypothetical protein